MAPGRAGLHRGACVLGYDHGMARKSFPDTRRLREEIASAAARMIAEDGMDFAGAKRKAARQIVGAAKTAGAWLPDNEQIEDEVRAYQAVFQSESQPAVLSALRSVALDWMERLDPFRPYLTGAVWNGTAGEHSDITLQLFHDNEKDVSLFLLNAGIEYETSDTRHFAGGELVEVLSFMVPAPPPVGDAGLHLVLYGERDLRGSARSDPRGRPVRGNLRALNALVGRDEALQDPPGAS